MLVLVIVLSFLLGFSSAICPAIPNAGTQTRTGSSLLTSYENKNDCTGAVSQQSYVIGECRNVYDVESSADNQPPGSQFYTVVPDDTQPGYNIICTYYYSDYGCQTFLKSDEASIKPDTCSQGMKYSYTAGLTQIQITLPDSVVTYSEYPTLSACKANDFMYAAAATGSCVNLVRTSSKTNKFTCDTNNAIHYTTYTDLSCGVIGDSGVAATMDCVLVAPDTYFTVKCVQNGVPPAPAPGPAPGPAPAPTAASAATASEEGGGSAGAIVGSIVGVLVLGGGIAGYYYYNQQQALAKQSAEGTTNGLDLPNKI